MEGWKTSWDPISFINLRPLMDISEGKSEIVIGLIDGPIDITHPAFNNSNIRTVNKSNIIACKNFESMDCMHGTFVAGILCGSRNQSIPAICPSCTIVSYPIFDEKELNDSCEANRFPTSSLKDLANAIVQTVDSGARVINLSIGVSISSLFTSQDIQDAYTYARQRRVIIVTAAGNQGKIGYDPLLDNYWTIPVVACDMYGRPASESNFGSSVGKRGLMAPGINIMSTFPSGKYGYMSGSSTAAPFVTGTLALILSIFPNAKIEEIMFLIRYGMSRRRSIIPPLLNAGDLFEKLKRKYY
jgi:subtilisin family serine protease